ncbi:MAG: histidine phosphatase family protein [Gemmatimonadota bacterium]
MSPRLYVLRHGRSEANAQGLIASSLATAGEHFGLTDEGRMQVRSNVGRIASEIGRPVTILASPLLRTKETAEIAREVLGGEVEAEPRLIERDFGELELEPDTRYEEVWRVDRSSPHHHTFGAEPPAAVLERVRAVADDAVRTRAGTVLLVTHGDVASILLSAARGAPLTRHREVGALATGELTPIDWPPAATGPIFDP